jgi:hypothetical protein
MRSLVRSLQRSCLHHKIVDNTPFVAVATYNLTLPPLLLTMAAQLPLLLLLLLLLLPY